MGQVLHFHWYKANTIMDLQDKAENKMLWLLTSVYSVFCPKCMWWLYKKSENETYRVKA